MTPLLRRLLDAGVISVLDMHFARGLARLHPDEPESVFLGAALASRAVRHGHVCLDLHRVTAVGKERRIELCQLSVKRRRVHIDVGDRDGIG